MNCFITKTGKRINCNGEPHDHLCKRKFNMELYNYLSYSCRIAIHQDMLAIEANHKLTNAEVKQINLILKHSDIYVIISGIKGRYKEISKFRPIRKLPNVNV